VLWLSFLPPHLSVTHCCHFPARQQHIWVCWALSRVLPTPDPLGCGILLPQGHEDNLRTGNLLLRCDAKQNNIRLINCVNYYISRGKKNLRAIISYLIYFKPEEAVLVFRRVACICFPSYSEGADSFQHVSKHCFETP